MRPCGNTVSWVEEAAKQGGIPPCYVMSGPRAVDTLDGPMVRVGMNRCRDIDNPDRDIAILLGYSEGATGDEVWLWNNRLWMKAIAPGKATWYLRGDYLLYPVTVLTGETGGLPGVGR